MKKEKIANIAKILENELPEIIKKIAVDYNIPVFIDNPDFLEKRLQKWHQFGLISHTKKVRSIFLHELEDYLKNWGVYEKVENVLNEKINKIKKKRLLEISIPLHDLGKIILYKDKRTNRKHEIASRDLLYQNFLNDKLNSMGLLNEHIDYIANYIKNHDALGKEIRDELKHNNKLNLKYLSGNEINSAYKNLADKYSNIKIEIGIFSLCDSIGKTNISINADTDSEIMRQESKIIQILKQKGLPSELKHAIMQLPLNVKLAETYLKTLRNCS